MAYHWVMLNGMIKLTKSNSEKQSYLCEPVNKLACSHFDYYLYFYDRATEHRSRQGKLRLSAPRIYEY